MQLLGGERTLRGKEAHEKFIVGSLGRPDGFRAVAWHPVHCLRREGIIEGIVSRSGPKDTLNCVCWRCMFGFQPLIEKRVCPRKSPVGVHLTLRPEVRETVPQPTIRVK